jgi:hypothetical protein
MKNSKNYLLFTQDFQSSLDEIIKIGEGGHVTQKFTDSVFVASFNDSAHPIFVASSESQPSDLDEVSKLMAEAWRTYQSNTKPNGEPPAPLPSANTTGLPRPQNPGNKDELRKRFEDLKQLLRSQKRDEELTQLIDIRMTGKVAVGILVVSGQGQLEINYAERKKICIGVMRALDFLIQQRGRPSLSFYYECRFLSIHADDDKTCREQPNAWEVCERAFVGPALEEVRKELRRPTAFTPGDLGILEHNEAIKAKQNTDWAYTAFFTKYQLDHYAYANGYGTAVFMDPSSQIYDRPEWKDLFSSVFAHETCHIFGAADEYSEGNDRCNCKEYGVNLVPNNNCVLCTDSGIARVKCLMDHVGDAYICPWTMGQIGWINPKPQGDPSIAELYETMHVVYRDTDDGISQIACNNGTCVFTSLSHILPEAPKAKGNPSLATSTSAGALHIFYRDENNEISHIYFADQTWQYESLHRVCPAASKTQGDISVVQAESNLHLVYKDVDGFVSYFFLGRRTNSKTNNWITYQLVDDKKLLKTQGDPRLAYFKVSGHKTDSLHVVFKDAENGIRELRWDENIGWKYHDLSLVSNSVRAIGDIRISQCDRTLYVAYRDPELGISGLWLDVDMDSWRHFSIGKGLPGYRNALDDPNIAEYGKTLHVVYRDVENGISHLAGTGGDWTYRSLSEVLKIKTAKAQGNPCIARYGDNIEIVYKDENNQVSDCSWRSDDANWHYRVWKVGNRA